MPSVRRRFVRIHRQIFHFDTEDTGPIHTTSIIPALCETAVSRSMRFPGKEGTKPVEKVVPRCLAACSVLRGIIRENK